MDTPTDRTLRLFESDFVEFFSNTKWFMIPIVWFPIVIYMLFTASAAVDNFNLGLGLNIFQIYGILYTTLSEGFSN